ncbi:hypothetical protein KKF91_10010 [Myxococcota bacterium]|nr:hypothetical protein [Myxococcota bacterium]MBU1899913.1 hypothetical protein [Myxococcota bacterium]
MLKGDLEAIYHFRVAYVEGDRAEDTCVCLALALEAIGWVAMAEKIKGDRPLISNASLRAFEEKVWVSLPEVYEALKRPLEGVGHEAARRGVGAGQLPPLPPNLTPRGRTSATSTPMPKLPNMANATKRRGPITGQMPKLPDTARRASAIQARVDAAPLDNAKTTRKLLSVAPRPEAPLIKAPTTPLAQRPPAPPRPVAEAMTERGQQPPEAQRADYRSWGQLRRALGGASPQRPGRPPMVSARRDTRYRVQQAEAFALSSEALKPYLTEGHVPLDPPLPLQALSQEILVCITHADEHIWVKGRCHVGEEALGDGCDQLKLALPPEVRAWLGEAR